MDFATTLQSTSGKIHKRHSVSGGFYFANPRPADCYINQHTIQEPDMIRLVTFYNTNNPDIKDVFKLPINWVIDSKYTTH